MSLIGGFNANEVKTESAIAKGTQATCLVVEAEDQKTKDETGEYLKLTFEVVEGEHKGKRIWENLNLNNQNEKAVQIARSKLSKLCLAIGCPEPKSNDELKDKPFRATFGEPREYNGDLQSVIVRFDPVGGSQAAADSLAAGKEGSAKPDWAKR